MIAESLAAEARASAVVLSSVRAETRDEAVRAIWALEARLRKAISGERLRGLPNLGTVSAPFFAARVGASRSARLPPDGREVLAILPDGSLRVVWSFRGRVETREVEDAELKFEDLPPFVRLVAELLERFVALSDRRTAKIERTGTLATRLLRLVEDFEGGR